MNAALALPKTGAAITEIGAALSFIDAPLLLTDVDGRIVANTAASARLLQMDGTCLRAKRLQELFNIPSFAKLTETANAGQSEWHVSACEYSQPVGSAALFDLRIAMGKAPEGDVYFTITLNDVSEHRAELDQLNSTNTRWQHALDSAQIGVFEIDLTTGKSVVSATWYAVMGLDPNSIEDTQKEWLARIHPQDLAIVQAADTACIEGKTQRSIANFRMRNVEDTHWQWMRSNAFVRTRDSNGKALTFSGTQIDITQSVQTEQGLRRSEEQFRSSFENGPIGMAIVGLSGGWERVNTALCEMFGYNEATFLATDFQSLTHPDDLDDDLEHLNQLLAGEIPSYQIEKRYFKNDGSIIWGLLSVGIVRDSNGTPEHFISQIVDITEERRLAELKSEFVATVSHELRTPLTSVLGALRLVSAQYGNEIPEAARGLLSIAQQNGDRLHDLISDILDYEKLSAGELGLEPAPTTLGTLVDDALLSNLPLADLNSVKIVSSCFDPKHVINVDSKRFHQIVTNLLSNATKFALKGTEINFDVTEFDDALHFSITNVGEGISDDFKSQVFKPFSQSASTSIRKHGGTGLGLSITQKIVQKMGGTIGFDSIEGAETTFWFTLPREG